MKRAAAVAAFLFLVTACGASTGSALHPSPSAAASSSGNSFAVLGVPGGVPEASGARLAPGISCSGTIGISDPVALVNLHTGGVVLRDYADTRNPRTACQFQDESVPAYLIDSRHVVIGTRECCNIFAVVDLPEVRFHWFQLPRPAGFNSGLLAVSPRLDEIAWLSNNDSTGGDRKVHITTKSGDNVVANLPVALGRCGATNLSKEGAYTHSGSHLYVLDQPLPSNTLIVFQGTKQVLSLVPPGGSSAQPEMAVWSPTSETLFYRQNGDVWQWTQAAGAKRYLTGVNWYYPTFSATGSHLAYAVPRSDGLHDIYLIDLAHSGSPQLIKGARNYPVFLNSTQLWYWTEGQGICGPGLNHPLVYDITDGSEAATIVDQVTAVWPATSSNF